MAEKQTEGQRVPPDTLSTDSPSSFDTTNSLDASNITSNPEVSLPVEKVKTPPGGKTEDSKIPPSEITEKTAVSGSAEVDKPIPGDKTEELKVLPQSEITEQGVGSGIDDVEIPPPSGKTEESKVPRSDIKEQDVISGTEVVVAPSPSGKMEEVKVEPPSDIKEQDVISGTEVVVAPSPSGKMEELKVEPQSDIKEQTVISGIKDVEILPPSSKTEESKLPGSEITGQAFVSDNEDVNKSPSSSKIEESKETQPQVADRTSLVLLENVDINKMSTVDIPTAEEVHLAPTSDKYLLQTEVAVGKFHNSDQISKSLDEAVTLGLGHFKFIMNEFVDSKKLYKTSDIIEYQRQAREAILQAFTSTFSSETLDPIILYSYKNKLTECLYSPELTFTFLGRYDHSTNTILKDLTRSTLEAERVYDDEMEGFEPGQKSENEIKERHILAREKAMAKFQEMKPRNFDTNLCSKEIEWKLKQTLQDLLGGMATDLMSQPGQNNTPEIYLGAFLDKEFIYVHTLEADSNTISELGKFSLDVNVRPGEEAPAPGSIYQLMTENAPTNHQGTSSSRSSDDIIKRFFNSLYSEIKTSWKNIHGVNDDNIHINLVITSAFPFTSYQKKRIRSSSLHYFRTTRVISSTTATAVKYFVDKANKMVPKPFQNEQAAGTETVERIIVVHPVEESFTMAVVESKSGVIESKGCFGSLNYDAFNKTEFIRSHSNVFSKNTAENSIDQEEVLKAYTKVQEDLLTFCKDRSGINTVIFAGKESESSLLNDLLKQLFENKELPIIAKDCHIQGACLIARNISKEHKWLIRDNTGGTFKVFVAWEKGENPMELPEQGFGHYVVKTDEKLYVTVWEVLNPGKVVEACKYFLKGKPQPPEESVEIVISPDINEDGVPGIIFDMPDATRGSIVDQHSLQEVKLGWFQFILAKILRRNY